MTGPAAAPHPQQPPGGRTLVDVDVAADPLALLPALREALAGSGPAVRPRPVADRPGSPAPGAGPHPPRVDPVVPDDVALVIPTSGSSGVAKQTMLTAAALTASADATHAVLGGPGRWLLALPVDHIAGIQVLVRSLRAGTEPVALPTGQRFTAHAFAGAARTALAAGGPTYTALVPTQLGRVLDDEGATALLARFDAVLVGGAHTPAELADRATGAGVRIVRTYGMSETGGGCVYDGQALPGTRVRLDPDGRVHLGGATVAAGYLGDPERTAVAFRTEADGTRWFRTDDEGRLAPDGRLEVLRRLDGAILTGGVTVDPQQVRAALLTVPEILDALVAPVADPQWGQLVGALLVLADPARPLDLASVRDRLVGRLPAAARPRLVRVVGELPTTGMGKPDRAAAAELLADGTDR